MTDAPVVAGMGAAGAYRGFPVVGIGASAGGLAAFEAFFSAMPADVDPGMAFVLVQHLAPDHKSILSDLVRKYTRMEVFEVEDGMVVRPNCAYIIPPNCDMAFLDGTLQLLEPVAPRGQRLPIDYLFRSLAVDQHERAICIVLSGTGTDGTLGVRAIKGEGGMAMAQTPASADFDGMPRSAISTGLIDFELSAQEMAAQLISYVSHAPWTNQRPTVALVPTLENDLKKIFVLLRAQTGHDFSGYKASTIIRRVERRMAVHQIDGLERYAAYLQQMPLEVEALFRDLLIGVTSFFRDPEMFSIVEAEVIPKLFEHQHVGATIRAWSVGCSTGEEAYSLAISLQEHLEVVKQGFTVQVFATDIDSRAIAVARAGVYPANIAADVTPERLQRFFALSPDGNSYRVDKSIRDMVIFSEHDVIKDPPFSKVGLISCRNLLIYMDPDLQGRVIPLFHYSLNSGGFLFLGTSENVGENSDLFTVVDRKAKVFARRHSPNSPHRFAFGRFVPPIKPPELLRRPTVANVSGDRVLALRTLAEQELIQHVVSAGALVTAGGDVVYLHGRSGLYLEPAPGPAPTNNILTMAREGLTADLTILLHDAIATSAVAQQRGVRVRTNGDFTMVDVTVRPVGQSLDTTPLYLVVLEVAAPATETHARASGEGGGGGGGLGDPATAVDDRILALQEKLRAEEKSLQIANEELETSNEECQSSNQEMQFVNEELQSMNEELETSQEELQSVNEELATVNAELQAKVVDLSRLNNDMNNLLAGTGIGTVFVDHQLRILRYTPTATRFINLIPGDVGRPVSHLMSNLIDYDNLATDVQQVLDTLAPFEREVQTTDGLWCTIRVLPYRTLDNVIEGAVITVVDNSKVAVAERERKLAQTVLEVAMNQSQSGIAVADAPVGKLRYLNDVALIIRHADRALMEQANAKNYADVWPLFNFDGRPMRSDEMPLARAVMFGETSSGEFVVRNVAAEDRVVLVNAAPVHDERGAVVSGVVVFTDVTERYNRTGVGLGQYVQQPADVVPVTSPTSEVTNGQ